VTTLKDIAKHLGLSPATVSRALNGFPEVNAKTRELVQQTAERLNYRPNQFARQLVSGRSGMVGMIIKSTEETYDNIAFFQVMSGLSTLLAEADLDLIFQASKDQDIVAPYERMLKKTSPDAFILMGPEKNDPRIDFLKGKEIPFVVHGSVGDPDYAFYDIDNKQVASSVVDVLYDLGHSRIAMINGPEPLNFARERREGYLNSMQTHGLTVPGFAVRHGVLTSDQGYTSALSLLSERRGPRPTAIVCASTTIADGVYRAAKDLGLSIPSDLSVVAHDDAIPEMRAVNFEPALTVTRSPIREASEPLALAVQELLKGKEPQKLQTIARAVLIVRNSTAPAPKERTEPW
jgi:LacI family transcriptional regulator